MAGYGLNDIKPGLKIMLDGAPHVVVDSEFCKPGKGQAFTRMKVRNLLTGRTNDKTVKSGDTVEAADVREISLQYLYADGDSAVFMSPESYEQYSIPASVLDDAVPWIRAQDICSVLLYNEQPVSLTPPQFVELRIAETDPGVRGDTASGGTKPATLETGAVVRVPLFVETGEVIRVDTRSGEYVSRVRD